MLQRTSAWFLLLWAAAVGAMPAQENWLPGSGSCWGRVYSAAHLASHPAQTVKSIHLWHELDERKHIEWHAPPDDTEHEVGGVRRKYLDARLYIGAKDHSEIRSERIRCAVSSGKMACKLPSDAQAEEAEPELLVARQGAAMLLERTTAWPLRALNAHVQTPGELSASPMRLSKDDVTFRLDRLPVDACKAVERAFAPAFAQPDNPPLLHNLDRSPRMCLTGRGRQGMAISLYFDSSMGDWPDGIDRFNFNVTQVVDGQRVKTHLSCNAFDYAWRCKWQVSDERPGAPNVGFASQTGALVREPGGAVLHGVPCLAGYCADPMPAQAMAIRFQRSAVSGCGT